MNATEYAISKDVRNSLIVREVDESRQRQLWRQVTVAIVLVIVAVLAAWQQVKLLDYEYKIGRMQRERTDVEADSRQLRLEIEKLRSPKLVEQQALGRLHMVVLPRENIVVLERVVPADPPPSSIVASR